MIGSKQDALGTIGMGDVRSAGALVQTGKAVNLVDADDGYEMSVYDQFVKIYLAAATAFNITLPSVSEAAGKFYCIEPTFAAGSVTISDKGGDAALGDVSCTTIYSYLFYSTGYKWLKVFAAATT